MKKFKTFRSVEQLKKICKERGWTFRHRLHDQGADHVAFDFTGIGATGTCAVSMVTGTFFGELKRGKRRFSSDSDEDDNKRWFNTLLNIVYVSE